MHYDVEGGVKDNRGFFSHITVVVLSVLLVIFGFYMLVNWFAPNIFFVVSDNRTAIENIVKNQPVQEDMLRIPKLEIEREIVPKKADGKIQISEKNNEVILSGVYHSLGVTPFDTKNLSPLAMLAQAEEGMNIYVDLSGARMAYRATEILKDTQPRTDITEDLVIYALDGTGTTAKVEVRAEKLGQVEIK